MIPNDPKTRSPENPLKVVIATPAYGGLVTTQYLGSLLTTAVMAATDNVKLSVYTMDNESLIPRARCKCAQFAMSQDFHKLLFIDADLAWSWEDVKRLLDSDKDIVGGTYPIKTHPITLNLNTLKEHEHVYNANKRHLKDFMQLREYADKNGEIEVRHIPTGLMCINIDVFNKLRSKVPNFVHLSPSTGEVENMYEFFPIGVKNGNYMSEDWAFCELARENGYKIHLNVKSVATHTGSFTYSI